MCLTSFNYLGTTCFLVARKVPSKMIIGTLLTTVLAWPIGRWGRFFNKIRVPTLVTVGNLFFHARFYSFLKSESGLAWSNMLFL
jgi:AGZA family xanthine/uracil permease-like MFS transporter